MIFFHSGALYLQHEMKCGWYTLMRYEQKGFSRVLRIKCVRIRQLNSSICSWPLQVQPPNLFRRKSVHGSRGQEHVRSRIGTVDQPVWERKREGRLHGRDGGGPRRDTGGCVRFLGDGPGRSPREEGQLIQRVCHYVCAGCVMAFKEVLVPRCS